MAISLRPRRRPPADSYELAIKAVKVAGDPKALDQLPPRERRQIDQIAKAVRNGSVWSQPGASSGTVAQMARARPVSAEVIARQAHAALGPSSSLTPIDIETALRQQGIDWVEPFAPGKPLTPYYGYNRRPRERNYEVGRNITTQTRPNRIPFDTLRHLIGGYDVASICYRHAIQDLPFDADSLRGHGWLRGELRQGESRQPRSSGAGPTSRSTLTAGRRSLGLGAHCGTGCASTPPTSGASTVGRSTGTATELES